MQLPDGMQAAIERHVAEGRITSTQAFIAEAASRYADDVECERELVAEAKAGIADMEAGRSMTMSTPEDAEAWRREMLDRLVEEVAPET